MVNEITRTSRGKRSTGIVPVARKHHMLIEQLQCAEVLADDVPRIDVTRI
jgi:hypothetical protein